MSEFYKVVDAKGRSYSCGENFTDPYVPALKAMGENHDDMEWSGWESRKLKALKGEVPKQALADTYEITGCRKNTPASSS